MQPPDGRLAAAALAIRQASFAVSKLRRAQIWPLRIVNPSRVEDVLGHAVSAIEGCRATIGATDPIKATPGSIRADYAQTIGRNLVHGSDSPEAAKREIPIWFEPHELLVRRHDLEQWLIET